MREILKSTDVSVKEVLPMLQCSQTITSVRKLKARLLQAVWSHKVHFRAAADQECSYRKTTALAGSGKQHLFFPCVWKPIYFSTDAAK